MKSVKIRNAFVGSTFITETPPPKLCRHRRRTSAGRCVDCGMHRDPMSMSTQFGAGILPSVPLAVRI